MKFTRRSAASLLGVLPFVGGALQGGAANQSIGAGMAMQGTMAGASQLGGGKPLMPHWRAARLALNDPMVRELARAVAFAQHRRISGVDPDIEVYRSFSPMAKITFQRQRNVDREIEQIATEPLYESGGIIQQMIAKFMWGK